MKGKGTKWNDPAHNFGIKSPYPLNVDNDECWNWLGALDKDGYGVFTLEGRKTPAHVAAYSLSIKKPEDGLYVLHKCNNSSCVNPNHLYEGTQKQNVQDQINAGTFVYGSKNGRSRLTEEQVLDIRKSSLSCRELADQYNYTYSGMWDIRNERSWKQTK